MCGLFTKNLLFTVLNLLAGLACVAQSPKQFRFELLTGNDGLSQGLVTSVVQDKTGFMWFGTNDGLNKYDGYEFTVYRNIPGDSGTIADDAIRSIFEDSKGRLWIGTAYKGLELFDRKNGHFLHIPHGKNTGPSSAYVHDIFEDKSGHIWLRTSAGIDRLTISRKTPKSSGKSGLFDNYSVKFIHIKPEKFRIEGEQTVLPCKDGRIYLTSKNEISEIVFDPKKPDEYRFFRKFSFNDLPENPASLLLDDTLSGSLFLVKGKEIWKFANHDFEKPRKIYQSENIIVASTIDSQGRLWVEDEGKFILINTATGKYETIQADQSLARAAESTVTHYTDPGGVVWMPTGGYGILKYHPARDYFHHELQGSNIYQILPGKGGELIVNGRNIYPLGAGSPVEKTPLIPSGKNPYTEPDWMLYAIQDREKMIWINAKNGILRYDKIKNEVKIFISKSKSFQPFPLLEGRFGNIWMGSERLLVQFNTKKLTFQTYPMPLKTAASGYDFVQAIVEDIHGILWLATVSGLLRFDPATEKWRVYTNRFSDKHSISHNFLLSLSEDLIRPERFLWIGTKGGGLNRLDKITGKFSRYSVQNGLPNNVIYGILPDRFGQLWMSTNKGISQFDQLKKTFRNFTVADGLQDNEFNRYAFGKRNDTLFFGGLNGINYFIPEQINALKAPNVFLTGLKLFNRPMDFKKPESPLKSDISYTKKISLAYNQNMIGLTFAAADYHATGRIQYRYMLKGFDKTWIYENVSHEATYTNLDPGLYQFNLQASLDGMRWGASQQLITIEIVAPWWKTWWFYTFAAVAFAIMLYGIYRYRLQQILRLQHLRNRISRDLHDEIGSSLSTISIYSRVAYEQLNSSNQNPQALLEKISENTDQAMEAMDDIIWSTNSENDVFENIINRMREHAVQLFEAKGYQLHFKAAENISALKLDMEKRKDFYLIYKEALNNIAKHAFGENVWIDISSKGRFIILEIKDDGLGYEATKKTFGGNGIGNMRTRAAALEGQLLIDSALKKGCKLYLQFPSR